MMTDAQIEQILHNDCESVYGHRIPEHMKEPIKLYLQHGISPGGFLSAVLSDHLQEALVHADDTNIRNLTAYSVLLGRLPRHTWGSRVTVDSYIEAKAKERQANNDQ